jgi:hypothetical protein
MAYITTHMVTNKTNKPTTRFIVLRENNSFIEKVILYIYNIKQFKGYPFLKKDYIIATHLYT